MIRMSESPNFVDYLSVSTLKIKAILYLGVNTAKQEAAVTMSKSKTSFFKALECSNISAC